MPSDKKKGGRRTEIRDWRVKAGNKEVYTNARKFQCEIWMRENKDSYRKLRLIPPNR